MPAGFVFFCKYFELLKKINLKKNIALFKKSGPPATCGIQLCSHFLVGSKLVAAATVY